jgi:sporulation protein YlmC with PRC-barrel domain
MDVAGVLKDIKIGADVYGSDGKKLGTVSHVIVQPPRMHVTDIVVTTGDLLERDVVVPVDRVEDVDAGGVYLSIHKDDLKNYPDYVEVEFRRPPPGWRPPRGFLYPVAAVLLPAAASLTGAAKVRVNAPPGTLGIQKGMEVESSDGQAVGTVEALDIDVQTGDITGFVLRRGLLFGHDVRIPVEDVREIHENKVVLKLTKDQIDRIEAEPRDSGE